MPQRGHKKDGNRKAEQSLCKSKDAKKNFKSSQIKGEAIGNREKGGKPGKMERVGKN